VSPYLIEGVAVGDALELRGPIGGYFVWRPARAGAAPAAGGRRSGIVPLMAMLRHRKSAGIGNLRNWSSASAPHGDVIYGRNWPQLAREDPRLGCT
jgi:ferredoxin-NADP reductase